MNLRDSFVEKLSLSDNEITDVGCQNLSQLLVENNKLSELDLSCNKITREGLKHITKAVKKNTHIKVLNFSGCDINLQKGFEGILENICSNCSLTQINLQGNTINDEFMEKLEEQCKQNQAIADIIMPSLQKNEKVKKRKKRKLKKRKTQQYNDTPLEMVMFNREDRRPKKVDMDKNRDFTELKKSFKEEIKTMNTTKRQIIMAGKNQKFNMHVDEKLDKTYNGLARGH